MQLEVLRFSSAPDSTSGLLFDVTGNQRKFLCYTVEDEYREEKVKHETRIPEGLYKLTLRSEGGFHNKHLARYGSDWHKGMIWVNDVPNFTFILWHSGNTDESTSGCLILGNSQTSNKVKPDGFVGASRDAYSEVYPLVRDAILSGESVTVRYIDFDHIDGKDFKAVITCPKWFADSEVTIDISVLLLDEIPEDLSDPREITLPTLKKNAVVRFPRLKDEKYLDFLENKSLQLWRFIDSIDGNTDKMVVSKVLEKLPIVDMHVIMNEITKPEYGLNSKINFICGDCERESVVNITIGDNFFS